jgi:hypothetical protein
MLPLHDTFVSCIGVGKEPLRIPLEDLARQPLGIAGLAVYLVSNDSSWMTGAALPVETISRGD